MFNPGLAIGQVLTEAEVHNTFECQTTLGIRRSKKNNLFVIMSGSAKKQVYNDVWEGQTLLYNGTDCNSDDNENQTLETGKGNNNKQLFDVWNAPEESRPQIFLFVKHEVNKCIYKGEAFLAKEPYWDKRHDDPSRKVLIFPLTLKNVDETTALNDYAEAERRALNSTLDHLKKKVQKKGKAGEEKQCVTHTATTTYYDRNPDVAAYAKLRAQGYCDLCGKEAPFIDSNGKPYLEAHHIIWLSNGGDDTPDNVAALCPNCHRRIHHLCLQDDVNTLNARIEYYLTNDI